MKFKRFAVLLICLLLLSLSLSAYALVTQGKAFYVTDAAEVLDSDTEQNIIDKNGYLESMNGAQIVVVTVKYLDGMYADEYATQLFNNWGVGSSAYNNGMLLLLAVNENKAWLVQGSGIADAFTDDMAGDYLDGYFWKYFDSAEYDKAVSSLFPALVSWYENYNGVSSATSAPGIEHIYTPDSYQSYGSYWGLTSISRVISSLVVIFIIIIVVVLIFGGRRGGGYRHTYYHPNYFFFNSRPPFPHNPRNGPRGPRGPGSGGGFGGFGGGSGFGGGGHSSGGGFGSGGHSGGGFGGGGHSSGGGFGSGGHSGGGFGGGGHSSGGGAGRR